MAKFPIDAPKAKVIKTLEALGFYVVREGNHIALARDEDDGTLTPMTIPITRISKARHCAML